LVDDLAGHHGRDHAGLADGLERGAENILGKIRIIQLEMSIVPLYEKEILYMEMINFLDAMGFELFTFENGMYENGG